MSQDVVQAFVTRCGGPDLASIQMGASLEPGCNVQGSQDDGPDMERAPSAPMADKLLAARLRRSLAGDADDVAPVTQQGSLSGRPAALL